MKVHRHIACRVVFSTFFIFLFLFLVPGGPPAVSPADLTAASADLTAAASRNHTFGKC